MTSKELIDELESEEKLIARGYRKEKCPHCKGLGFFYTKIDFSMFGCSCCDGQGFLWIAPVTK